MVKITNDRRKIWQHLPQVVSAEQSVAGKPSMAPHPLAISISLVSGILSLLAALALPFGYFALNYAHHRGALEAEAAALAEAASEVMRQKPRPAATGPRLPELARRQPHVDAPIARRITDLRGTVLAQTQIEPDPPQVKFVSPITNAGVIIGQVEITSSLRPLLIRTFFSAFAGLALGWIVFALLRFFPFRALHLAIAEILVRRQTEGRLKESLGLLTATLESTADGIMAEDSAGRIVVLSQRFVEMWKIPPDIVAARDDQELRRAMFEQLSEPAEFDAKLQILRKQSDTENRESLEFLDGRVFEWHSIPQMIDGKNSGRVSSFHDISELRRATALLIGEKSVLETIVNGLSLREALSVLVRNIEEQSGAMFCAILFRTELTGELFTVACRSLPPNYVAAVEGTAIIPAKRELTAAVRGESDTYVSIVDDLAWKDYRELVAGFGLAAHGCSPILSPNGSLLGAILTHYRSAHSPHPRDRELVRLSVNLARITIERKQSEARLDHLAHHDALTGLANRSLLLDRLAQAKARADRDSSRFAVLFLDLDRFKTVNDTLGHVLGDALLKTVAERLRGCVRANDTVTRLGGDEFTVVVEDVRDTRDAALVADKIIEALAPPCLLAGHEVFVTTSCGIAIYPEDGGNIETLLKNADSAMYRAKQEGRNHYQFYTAEMNARNLDRLEMESGLRRALEREEFELYYQPKVNLRSGKIAGAEVLLRWNHPERGLVSPAAFVPLLEETGMITQVGEWALRAACGQAKAWQDAGLRPLSIAVNLSARQFLHNDLARSVGRVLDETGMDPRWLELEITESMLMHDPEQAIDALKRIRAMGVLRIDVDDFGTGYSSLSQLKRFPIHALKLDQSFVRGIPDDEGDCAIAIAVMAMAKSLKLKVIAEGVETPQQRAFLASHHCDEAQGFLLGRPACAEDFAARLRESELVRRALA